MNSWRSEKSSLINCIEHLFNTGLYADVTFEVGKNKSKINVHQFILSARSEPLAVMMNERWTQKKDGIQIIKITEFDENAFKTFLKFLYTDQINFKECTIDDILEIACISHMYQVEKLFDHCKEYLQSHIDETNCVQVYKSMKLLDVELSLKAYKYFEGNIIKTATHNQSYLNWDASFISELLLDDRSLVPEITLFNALLNWRNVKLDSRKEEFDNLVRFIRFPTIDGQTIAAQIAPHNILPKEEILELLTYVATNGSHGNIMFNKSERQPWPTSLLEKPKGKFFRMYTEIVPINFDRLYRNTVEGDQLTFIITATTPLNLMGINFFHISDSITQRFKKTEVVLDILTTIGSNTEVVCKKLNVYYTHSKNFPNIRKVLFKTPLQLEAGKEYVMRQTIKKFSTSILYVTFGSLSSAPDQSSVGLFKDSHRAVDMNFDGENSESPMCRFTVRKSPASVPLSLERETFVFVKHLILQKPKMEEMNIAHNIKCPLM